MEALARGAEGAPGEYPLPPFGAACSTSRLLLAACVGGCVHFLAFAVRLCISRMRARRYDELRGVLGGGSAPGGGDGGMHNRVGDRGALARVVERLAGACLDRGALCRLALGPAAPLFDALESCRTAPPPTWSSRACVCPPPLPLRARASLHAFHHV